MNIKITADSTCDLSPELVKKYDIDIIPLSVFLGEESFKDGVEMKPEDIYSYVKETGMLPKTSAVNVDEYVERFDYWRGQGYDIVHFCISSDFSSSYQNACLAAKNRGNVYVVDSRNLSTGEGLLVLRGAELAKAGLSASEIQKNCIEAASLVEASFVIDSVDYLYKGGRCSALAALGANLLKLKPCIEVIDGKMVPGKKYRGQIKKDILEYVSDRLKGRTDLDYTRIFITHTTCSPDCVESVRNLIRTLQPEFKEILETDAGSTVTTHCGPWTLGVLFLRKP